MFPTLVSNAGFFVIKSMTGFGRSVGSFNGHFITLDLRSVNHRFFEISIRLPKDLNPLEGGLKQTLRKGFSRGKVDLIVSFNGGEGGQKKVLLDKNLAKQYHHQLLELKKIVKLPGAPDFNSLVTFKDLLVVKESPLAPSLFEKPVKNLLKNAMTLLGSMRKKEGQVLERYIRGVLKRLHRRIFRIEKRVPMVVEEHQNRLMKKIQQISGVVSLDQTRLHQEVAYFAERSDVEEEITRLKSHCEQFEIFLSQKKPIGRSLDFLVQEMNREVNTLGAKANDTSISEEVIEIKGELERLREQCQNIE